MPYRVDLSPIEPDTFDRLIELGAIDAELTKDGLAAVMPDSVSPQDIAAGLGGAAVSVSSAVGRDAESVWILRPRPIRIGRLTIVPADADAATGAIRLIDAAAFGTGLHPTTALCLEALEGIIGFAEPDAVLDVGTGSGVLALASLHLGVQRAMGIDVDDEALRVAAENARLNTATDRFTVRKGGPETLSGTWPLVVANVLAAPLIELAPALVRRVGHHGRLVLSGIPSAVEHDVEHAYRRFGMRHLHTASRGGWVAVVMQGSW